jgi:general secretion pathway protein D
MASHRTGRPRLHLSRLLALSLAVLALGGCAAQMAFREGRDLVAQDKLEAGLKKYQEAIAADPGNAQYKSAWLIARDRNATRLLEQAERQLAAGQGGAALLAWQRVLSIDPANERARAGLRLVEMDERHTKSMEAAHAAFERKDYEQARARVQAILAERPNHEAARLLNNQISDKTAVVPADTGLAAAYRQPITLEFKDAPLKQIFEVISRRSGLNFLFDKDVKTDQRASIFLKNSSIEAAVYYLLVTNQLEQQVMDGNTVLVYPNVAAKLKEYQEMTVKTFFLANAEAKTVGNTLKTILKSRDVVVDEKLNLIILRDSPEAVRLATKLIALQDVAEAEVMLDVEILEIKRSRILDLGIAWPQALTLAPLTTADGGPLTLDVLRTLRSSDIGVSGISAKISANKADGDSNTLANPRIRVRNKEKAKVVVGDKVPVITTTISPGAGGFASESVNYIDVGLTLNVEPTIYLNNEVAIRIGLEVSNLVSTTTTKSGTLAYQLGNRQASTMLQLKDGETQVLAGLINNEDRSSGNKVPGLGSLPIIGRLFGTSRDDTEKTEIVLSITPHLVRNVQRPSAAAAEFSAGTETGFRRRPDVADKPATVMPVRTASPAAAPAPAPQNVPAAPQQQQQQQQQSEPSAVPPVIPAPAQAMPPPVQNAPGAVVTPIPAPPPRQPTSPQQQQ